MRYFRRRDFDKPPLGLPLAGNNLAIGLQIAAILNEAGSGGPWVSLGSPITKVYNLVGRNHGTGAGILGASPPNHNWVTTLQGSGFLNQSASSGGAIDFGPISNYQSFANGITVIVLAGWSTPGATQRAVIAYDGSNLPFSTGLDTSSGKWFTNFTTTGGTQTLLISLPSHGSNPNFMDNVAWTYDNATVKGYLNGILKNSAAINQNLSFVNTVHINLTGSSVVNNVNDQAPVTAFYVWNRALTAAEIQQVYLDPYWALVPPTRSWRTGKFNNPPPPPPPPSTPTAFTGSPITSFGRVGKGAIKQTLIEVPEMQSFEDVRQVMAKALNDLQLHIASQLPVTNHQGLRLTNVSPPIAADDVVTLKYLQSIYVPPGTSTKT